MTRTTWIPVLFLVPLSGCDDPGLDSQAAAVQTIESGLEALQSGLRSLEKKIESLEPVPADD